MRAILFSFFCAFCDVNLFDQSDFPEFTMIILLLLSETSNLSGLLFEASMNGVLWGLTTD